VKSKGNSGGFVGNLLATSAGALLIEFVLQTLAGWYLNRAYIPDPKHAHDTMQAILGATPHSQIAGFHYWGGAFFIVHSFLHLCLMLFTGWYRPPHHWRWIGAVAIFGCAMLFQLTGNLLPFDQHGVQTAAIESGIAASMPGGQAIASLIMGGEPSFNANTLPTWYMAHRFLIPLALILGSIGAVATHYRRGDVKTYWIPAALLALVLHGSLEAFGKLGPSLGWIGTGLIPGLFAVFLIAAPMLSKRVANAGIQLGFVAFLVYFLAVGVAFGGGFAPLTGTRDPVVAVDEPSENPNQVKPVDDVLAEKGRLAFNRVGCAGCHGTDGLKASGGPKLDQVHKEHSDAEWYIEFIKNPKSKKPTSTMPGYPNLSAEELSSIAEFLRKPR
jgi:mono/diheme cytochrome c family protein